MKYIITGLLIFFCVLQANAQNWKFVHQNPIPAGTTLNDVFFLDPDNGWAVGEAGVIIHTLNGGNDWQVTNYDSTFDFTKVVFSDNKTGWILTSRNYYLKTSNGGESWQPNKLSEFDSPLSIYFADAEIGWMGSVNGLVYKTYDGGKTWSQTTSLGIGSISNIFFLDNQHGWLCTNNGNIAITSNGGISWQAKSFSPGAQLANIIFTDLNTGYLTDKTGIIYRTLNGGEDWSIVHLSQKPINNIRFDRNGNGWAALNEGTVLQTSDGVEWIVRETGFTPDLHSILPISADKVIVVGFRGVILKSTNFGVNWSNMVKGTLNPLSDFTYINEKSAWTMGFYGTLLHTVDGGNNWNNVNVGNVYNITSGYYLDNNTGWIAQIDGAIRKTTDAGNNWIQQTQLSGTNYLLKIRFYDSQLGIGCGANGTIVKTIDGGATWLQGQLDIGVTLVSLCFIDRQNICAVGQNGVAVVSTDGGNNWTLQDFPSASDIYDIYFINKNKGWAVTVDGHVYKTIDGGETWQGQKLSDSYITSIKFLNENIGMLGGNMGLIFYTSDGGANWTKIQAPSLFALNCGAIINQNEAWLYGINGNIIKMYAVIDSLTTGGIAQPICAGKELSIPYTANINFNSGNEFIVQLSDKNGSFAQPLELGRINGTSSGVIQVKIPLDIIPGNGYRIRVISSDPAVIGKDNGVDLRIIAVKPEITGEEQACSGETVSYNTKFNENSNYLWVAMGGVIITENNQPSIQVRWESAGTGVVKLYESVRESQCMDSTTLNVNVFQTPDVKLEFKSEFCIDEPEFELSGGTPAGGIYLIDETPQLYFNAATIGAGSHTVSYFYISQDACSKTAYQIVNIFNLPPKPTISFNGTELVSSAESGNQWYFDGAEIPNAKNKTHKPVPEGNYSVRVVSPQGCISPFSDEYNFKSPLPLEISIDSAWANTGDTVRIPVRINGREKLFNKGITGFNLKLKFNGTILYPLTNEKGVFTFDGFRTMNLAIDTAISNNNIIFRIPFLAMLGVTDTTHIVIEEITPIGGNIEILKKNGYFKLLNVCEEGGKRFVEFMGLDLQSVNPNPGNEEITIKYNSLYNETIDLSIINTLGINVKSIYSGAITAGEHENSVNIIDLAPGAYFIVLKSGYSLFTIRLDIVR